MVYKLSQLNGTRVFKLSQLVYLKPKIEQFELVLADVGAPEFEFFDVEEREHLLTAVT